MAVLELTTLSGKTEHRELSRRQPLSIGKQSFNDIAIDDDGVGPLHCRISWNREAYEVTAAVKEGVDVNGKFVEHAVLKSGDVLRIGKTDLVFRDSAGARPERDSGKDSGKQRKSSSARHDVDKSGKSPAHKKDKPHGNEANEMSLFEGPVIAESVAEMVAEPEVLSDESVEMSGLMLSRSQGETISRGAREAKPGEPATAADEFADLKRRVSTALAADRVRPGEQDIFKSPLILGLGGGGLVVLLVTAMIWFLMGRQVAFQHYDRAVKEFSEGRYTQAIGLFESFLEKYPGHSLSADARIGVGRARIQKELSGATPSWKRGQEELEKFIEEHRNDADFKSLQPGISQFAEQIGIGAAKTAGQVRDPDLLVISADATRRLEQFADPQNPPLAGLEQIRTLTEQAKAAIRKQKTFDDAFVIIDRALQQSEPIAVLHERAKLLQTYPDFANQKRVREALQKAIEIERSVVSVTDLDQPATAEEPPFDDKTCIIPVEHTRSRTDESASGRYVYAQAHDALFAVDITTGEVAWRKLNAPHPPFFPVLTAGEQPGLLIGESNPPSLVLRHAETGRLIWRQSIPAAISGSPLILEGEIFIAARNRSLYRLDLDSGRLKEQLTFSQDVVGPPMVTHDGEHLLIAGDAALLYGLSIRPWKVVSITFSAHPPAAVAVPLLAMGKLALMCENDRLDSCRLRVWEASVPQEGLTEAPAVRISGQVFDRPVLRGSQLVVASTGERLEAFTVNDDPEKRGLTSIGSYKVQDGYQGPQQLSLGPDQQFWLASSAFRRFQVSNDSLRADSNTTAPGIASQPLQLIGEQFFVARRPPYAAGVVLTQIDRERMAGSWRTTLGSQLLAWTAGRNGGLVAASETGTVFTLSTSRLKQGGFEMRSAVALEVPTDVVDPLGAARLSDGRLAVWCQGPTPRLWLINTLGQLESAVPLEDPVIAPPIALKQGLVLPQRGRLKWHTSAKDGPRIQDFVAAVDEGAAVEWRFTLPLDDKEFLICDAEGRLSRIQIRQDDVMHLAEAAKFKLPQPVDVAPVLQDDELWIADAAGTLFRLDSRSFDVKGQRDFGQPAQGVWSDGSSCYVQLTDGTLHAVTSDNGLSDRWTAQRKGVELLGSPVKHGDQLLWVGRTGLVLQLSAETGRETAGAQLPQSLALGLTTVEDALFASAIDGSIYVVKPPEGARP